MKMTSLLKFRRPPTRLFIRLTATSTLAVAMLVGCSPESPKLVEPPTTKVEKIHNTDETATFNPRVDILFVVDDSGSMSSHQSNLSANVKLFIQEIQKNQILDYHIGVVTTSMDGAQPYDPSQPWSSGCDDPNSRWSSRACGDGRLVRYKTQVPFVDKNTPNGLTVLESNLLVGTSGSGTEASFDPIHAALSAPLVNTTNTGFLRADASLAVIIMTDAEDQSDTYDAKMLYSFLLGLKSGKADRVLAYAALVPSNVSNPSCPRDDTATPLRIEEFLGLAKGTEYNICDPDYGQKLAHIAADVVQKVGKIMYLSRRPIKDTITVQYGSQVIPNDPDAGWVYDPVHNALLFGPKLQLSVQPAGTNLEVNFTAGN